jgi:hypothetical protein
MHQGVWKETFWLLLTILDGVFKAAENVQNIGLNLNFTSVKAMLLLTL